MTGERRLGRPTRPGVALIGAVIVLVVAFGAVVHAAGASGVVPSQPLAVQTASVVQEGQDLVWQLELAQPVSPGALRRDHRSVCLLIGRAANGSVVSQVCLSGPRRGARLPELIYTPVTPLGPAPARAIAAKVTRLSGRELTASFLPASIGLGYRPLRWQVISGVTAPDSCVAAVPGSASCAVLFPATPALVRLHTPRLIGCVATGPDWVFHGPRREREIALTFDDGPWWQPLASRFAQPANGGSLIAVRVAVAQHQADP